MVWRQVINPGAIEDHVCKFIGQGDHLVCHGDSMINLGSIAFLNVVFANTALVPAVTGPCCVAGVL